MARRNSLSDKEVAIIKKLISLGKYTNQEIAGLVNRYRGSADLDISTGRISNIKNDQIKRYSSIKPATDDECDAFLQAFSVNQTDLDDPISDVALKKMLKVKSLSPLALDVTETDRIECKRSINFVMKTMAAFANNKGGYLLFGVENKTWEVVGVDERKFSEYDFNKLNQNILSSLGCGLEISRKLYELQGRYVGVIYVYPARSKPVIMSQGSSEFPQGSIYFRYPGEDRLISRTDLQNILEERLRQLSETILLKHISNIFRFGIENSAVLDLTSGVVDGKSGSFLIDEKLLPDVKFIKEGEFVEKSGAPTLKLIGEVAQAAKVITRSEKIIDSYPYSWRDLFNLVKKARPSATNNIINRLIRETGMKQNPAYSVFNFRNKKQADLYEKRGRLSQQVPSLYNNAALELLISRLSE